MRLFVLLVLLVFLVTACAPVVVEEPVKVVEKVEVTQPPVTTQKDIGEVKPGPEDIVAEAKPALKKLTPRTPPQEHLITIAAYKFNPKTLRINMGDIVVWKNLGKTPHEVLSNEFHSNPLFQNDTFVHVFNTKGNFTTNSARYRATIGKIVVS